MNFKILLSSLLPLGISLPIFSLSLPISDISPLISVSSSYLGPFTEGEDSKISFNFTLSNSRNLQIFIGYGIKDGLYPTSYIKANQYYVANNKYDVEFNLPGNCIKKSGTYGVVKFLNPDDLSTFANYKFHFYASSYSTIDVNDYRKANYISKNILFRFYNNEVVYDNDQFNFLDLQNYIDVDSYYCLDLSRSSINFNKNLTTYAKSIELIYADKNNCFPNLKKSSDNSIHIPLNMTFSKRKLIFAVKNYYYYNPINLDLSSTMIDGYKMTKNIYLPINKQQLINQSTFTLSVKEFGRDKVSFAYDLLFDVSRLKYGTCNNSDYCIKGEISK